MDDSNISPEGEVALLIFAANGGSMELEDHKREFQRVMALSREDFIRWYDAARRLAGENAIKYFEGRLDP